MNYRVKWWLVWVAFPLFCGMASYSASLGSDHGFSGYPSQEFDTINLSEIPTPGMFSAKRVVWHMKSGKTIEIRPDGKGALIVKEVFQ